MFITISIKEMCILPVELRLDAKLSESILFSTSEFCVFVGLLTPVRL